MPVSFPFRHRFCMFSIICTRLAVCVTLLVILTTGGCRPSPADATSHATESLWPRSTFEGKHPIRAVCTTGQVADAVRAIGGPQFDVTALMGPGVDPHLYTSRPSDI
jgi:manganese/zinc/iron transport system substrate-binding protein